MRSLLEYALVVFHLQLSQALVDLLESYQTKTLRTMFGYRISKREVLERSGLESLSIRRRDAVKRFVIKTASNPALAHWYQKRQVVDINLRVRTPFVEYQTLKASKKTPHFFISGPC